MSVGQGTVGETITVEELERDPYPIYARLRAEEPVSRVEAVGLWLVTLWADVLEVVEQPELYTGETDPSTLERTFGRNLLASEGAYHHRIRSIIEPAFRPGAVRPYVDTIIEPIADRLVDAFAHRGEVELMAEFAEQLSVASLQHVMGLQSVDGETLRQWFGDLGLGASNFEQDAEKQRVADAASAEVDERVLALLDEPGALPEDSILARMRDQEVDGERLTPAEICSNLKVMLVGGMQEPGDAVGIGLWALLSHPEQADEVRADPETLVRPAVEEGLRWHSPVGTSTRQTTRPTTLAGVDLEQGALIAAVVSSANRDERHWSHPDRYDIHRKGAHLAFTTGTHHCVGSWLARAEVRTAFRVLLARLPNLRLDDDRPIELHGWEFRGPKHLHLRWDP
jgi:cytochrome P450